jgi:hypothetical protein
MKQLKELTININDFNPNEKVDKLVLTFDNETQIEKFNQIYPELILKKIYPLTKGIPFCKAKIEHCLELFYSKGTGKKKKECASCKLLKYCDYNDENFDVIPILNPSKDLIKFLEERNENLNDWI